MRAAVRVIPSRRKHVHVKSAERESFDVHELASEAANALEAYRRAPWRQLSERTRMAKLRRAIELLNRVEGLETGRISDAD
jgi:acyl-CoA reductase-like NAD-dependent aldehyde dehydrogenase